MVRIMLNKERLSESLKIFYVVSCYWIVSISLIFLNKWLLSNSADAPDAPLFVTWIQCIVTALLCYTAMATSRLGSNKLGLPELNFSLSTMVQILPLSIVFVVMVSFNNLCLKHLNVSFYYLARSLTTVFNVIFTYVLLKTITSRNALICCGIIVFGYGSGVNIEGAMGSLSLYGLLFGLGSSITCALTSILTARSLPMVEGSIWRLTFYNNLNGSLLFIPAIILTEGRNLMVATFWTNANFWFMLILSGVLGFAIGYVSTMQIKVTSPLTHNICGTAKAAAQTVLAVIIYSEVKSFSWWCSNAIVLIGSAAYACVRHSEMLALKKPTLVETKKGQEKPLPI